MKLRNIFLLLILFACNHSSTNSDVEPSSLNFDFLLGNWQRLNNQPGHKTFEQWEKESEKEYKGLGFTIENKDTIFKEIMNLSLLDEGWNLKVSGPNELPVRFKLSNHSHTSFVCENKNHDFPQQIEYIYFSDTLKAKVSGNGQSIDFDFVPKKINDRKGE